MAAPASLTEQFDTLYSTTWQNMRERAIDQIFKATPLTYRLYQKGIKRESGGRWIGYQLLYGQNSTVKTIGIGGAVDVVNDELITTAKDDWKWLIANVIRYFGEDTMNQGKQQIMNMVQAKLKVCELSLVDALETMLIRGPGSLTAAGTDLNGLCTFITQDGTGSPGGIDASTYTWWKNQFTDATNTTVATIMADVQALYNTCSIGNDHPTLLLGTQLMYEFYERRLQNILRTYDTSLGDLGFEALRYKGAAWTFSPTIVASLTNGAGGAVFVGGGSKTHGMFMLNERYWDFVVHPDADFYMTEWKPIPNQLDRVSQIVVQGNLICTNRRMQGLLFDVDAAILAG
jgi:hypothetical protein